MGNSKLNLKQLNLKCPHQPVLNYSVITEPSITLKSYTTGLPEKQEDLLSLISQAELKLKKHLMMPQTFSSIPEMFKFHSLTINPNLKPEAQVDSKNPLTDNNNKEDKVLTEHKKVPLPKYGMMVRNSQLS